MKSLITNILFFAVILLIITKFLCIASDTHFPIDVVTSDSMSPTLMKGDIIMWAPKSIQDVQPGDMIIYDSRISWPEERLVAHRVIEVTNRGQSKYLTTKGDANPWPDQSGPHLPEPKITKENYVGTILTLGSIPIKIPLVGNIGIFALEGLSVLSQAARTKDTLTYLGVFLPVTIALILLFLSLLLIPEKAKTTYDKIRLLIIKEKGIPLKQMIGMLLLGFFLLSTCAHIFAYDSFEASIGVNEPSDSSTFSFGQISQGQTSFPKYVPLINPGIMPLHGFVIADGELTEYLNRQTFYIAPTNQIQLNITASAPPTGQNGIYYGSLKIYSSSLWLFLPEPLINNIITTAPLQSVYILDFISALFFTLISVLLMFILILISYHTQETLFRKTIHLQKISYLLTILTHLSFISKKPFYYLYHKLQWISALNIQHPQLPHILLPFTIGIICSIILHFNHLLIIIVPFITTTSAYFLGYKTRKDLIVLSNYSCILTFGILSTYTLYTLVQTPLTPIQILSQILGVLGTNLLLIGIFLFPLSILLWKFISLLQNLKESINPLQQLEGHCNL